MVLLYLNHSTTSIPNNESDMVLQDTINEHLIWVWIRKVLSWTQLITDIKFMKDPYGCLYVPNYSVHTHPITYNSLKIFVTKPCSIIKVSNMFGHKHYRMILYHINEGKRLMKKVRIYCMIWNMEITLITQTPWINYFHISPDQSLKLVIITTQYTHWNVFRVKSGYNMNCWLHIWHQGSNK